MIYTAGCKSRYTSILCITLITLYLPLRPSVYKHTHIRLGTRWRSWLGNCATRRKVAGLIFDGVTGNFHWHNPSGRTVAMGKTRPLNGSEKYFLGVKAAGGYSHNLHVPIVMKRGQPQPPGKLRASLGNSLLIYMYIYKYIYIHTHTNYCRCTIGG